VLGAKIDDRAIFEPIQCCPLGAPATEMRELVGQRGFDMAGVMLDPTGPVIGFVIAKALSKGTVKNHKKHLSVEHLIPDAPPIADLMGVLQAKERAFVLVGPELKSKAL
jgi:hypothetical protein